MRLPGFATVDALCAVHSKGITAQGLSVSGTFNSRSVAPREIEVELSRRQTVVFERLQDSIPEVAALCRELATALGFPTHLANCNLFMTPPGGGIIKHFDDQDVWLIGLRGTKHVTVAPNYELIYPTANSVTPSHDWYNYFPLTFSAEMPAEASSVPVSAGTVLFMPHGLWHATAAPDGAWSLSFGIRRPSWRDLVLELVAGELLTDPGWAQAAPADEASAAEPMHERLLRLADAVLVADPERLVRAPYPQAAGRTGASGTWRGLVLDALSRELLGDERWREPVRRVEGTAAELAPVVAQARERLSMLARTLRSWDTALLLRRDVDPMTRGRLRLNPRAAIAPRDGAASTIVVEDDDSITELTCDDSIRELIGRLDSSAAIPLDALRIQLGWPRQQLILAVRGLLQANVILVE